MSGIIIASETTKDGKGRPLSFKMPEGEGHYLASPNDAGWGQIALILFLNRLSIRWALKEPKHRFGLGDLGKENLGNVHSHIAHKGGLSVDIYVIHTGGLHRQGKTNMTFFGDKSGNYDAARTKKLAELILEVSATGFPIFQWLNNDPEVQKVAPKLIHTDKQDGRNPQHDDHMHIQLRGTHPHTPEHVQALLRLDYKSPY